MRHDDCWTFKRSSEEFARVRGEAGAGVEEVDPMGTRSVRVQKGERTRSTTRALRPWLIAGSAVVATSALACSFYAAPWCDPSDLLNLEQCMNHVSQRDPYEARRAVVFEEPRKIRMEHGHSCAADRLALSMHDSAPIPKGFDRATIISNGWLAGYGSDNQVRLLGNAIHDVKITPAKTLEWTATGALTDDVIHDIDWCYWYTLVFWNSTVIDASEPDPAPPVRVFPDSPYDSAEVHRIPGSIVDPGDKHAAAILPRGFALAYDRSESDHHLLQAGFRQGFPNASSTDITWTSESMLKDNGTPAFRSGEISEKLSGTGVSLFKPGVLSHLIHDPPAHFENIFNTFELSPRSSNLFAHCPKDMVDLVRNDYCVELPFYVEFAVPMLTGWKIDDACSDSNVKQMGAYIDHFTFSPVSPNSYGSVCYQVVTYLSDNKGGRQVTGTGTAEVTILALNPRPSGKRPPVSSEGGPAVKHF
jgi:hypothetical protein